MRIICLVLITMLALPFTLPAQVPVPKMPKSATAEAQQANRHYALGWRAMHSENWAEAAKEFQQAIDSDPKFNLAYYALGRAEMGLRNFPKAIAAYIKCRNLYVTSSGERFTNQLEATRRLDDRILETQTALTEANNQSSSAKGGTQSASLMRQELQRQLDQLQQARDRNINYTVDVTVPYFVPMALGAAFFRNGQFADAEREYKAAIDTNPDSGETHNNLAVLYLLTGRLDDSTREIALAEKSGFRVNPQFKQDLEAKRKGK
jgi:tetratricopeptide (TPR) repeat protein